MADVRSVHAFAEIRQVDGTAAHAIAGVVGVYTASDFPGLPPLARSVPSMERPSLATGMVRFVGEPIAVVIARDKYLAADAAAAVAIEYVPLEAVSTVEAALRVGAPLLFPNVGSNVVYEVPAAIDVEADLSSAPHRAHISLVNQRCAAAPMEPFGVVSDWGPKGLTMWASCQAPHWVRNRLHDLLGLSLSEIHVIAPDVGGGFGAKQSWYPEYVLTALLSRRLGRPVKFIESRSENLVAMTQGRDQLQEIDVGFDDEGRILVLRANIIQNVGAYPYADALGLPFLTMAMAGGCYKIPRIATSYKCVVTNTTQVASYRGAGRPEASYLIERVVDTVSDLTGIDPLEVRRRNFIAAEEFPFASHLGMVYDSGNYAASLEKLMTLIDYPALRQEQSEHQNDISRPLIGIGFSTFVEVGGFGPSAGMEGFGMLGGYESANVRVNHDASVTVMVGTSPHGQGHETAFAQIAADALGLPYESISVLHGDTEVVQEGIGTFGSRSIPVGGEAVKRASTRALDKAKTVAAQILEASPGDIELRNGQFSVTGSPARSLSWAEVANKAYRPSQLGTLEAGIEAIAFHEPPNNTFPFGAHCCVVEVDRDSGVIALRQYVAVDDCGVVINPMMAHGQIMGGVVQGIAQALYEKIAYSKEGQPLSTTLADYLVPSAAEMPRFVLDQTVTPSPSNSLGAKGLGESGATAAPQAVVNAVVDALSHLGVRNLSMPVTPEDVWRAMNDRPNDGGIV